MKPIKVTQWQNQLGVDVHLTKEVLHKGTVSLQNEQVKQLINDLKKPIKEEAFTDQIGMNEEHGPEAKELNELFKAELIEKSTRFYPITKPLTMSNVSASKPRTIIQ